MLGSNAMDSHYANIVNCAVCTNGSDSFFRWKGAPEERK